jgi:hypothetical protein
VVRASLLLQAGRLGPAREAAQRALAREPDLVEAYGPLLVVSLREERFADTTKLMLETYEKFGLAYAFESEAHYAKYVASPEYQPVQKALADAEPH